jgi:membrane protease YdiL (CAAX protease family)
MINLPSQRNIRGGATIHPGWQLLILIGILFATLLVGNLLGIAIVAALFGMKTVTAIGTLNAATPHILTALWILQITGTTLPILACPVLFATVVTSEPQDYLKTNFRFHWGLLLLVLFVMLLSLPSLELLSNINQKLKLPTGLKGLEDWMKSSEKEAEDVTNLMLSVKTLWGLLFDVLLIGLVTAAVEEFLFRGAMQTIFFRWTKNIHAAVWITAIIFSAFHLEFYGFLPRVLLGALFGYFVAWSGSIWPAVWGHFVNNGLDVVVTYLYQNKIIKVNPDDQQMFNYAGYGVSLLILIALMWIFKRVATNPVTVAEMPDGKELG